jgi:hypothetical protein
LEGGNNGRHDRMYITEAKKESQHRGTQSHTTAPTKLLPRASNSWRGKNKNQTLPHLEIKPTHSSPPASTRALAATHQEVRQRYKPCSQLRDRLQDRIRATITHRRNPVLSARGREGGREIGPRGLTYKCVTTKTVAGAHECGAHD